MMSKPLCLVVDDEPHIRELLEITLLEMDIGCYTAQDLREAQEHLHNYMFDLCLTDMRLPDGDGIELVKLIQQDYPHVPVIMITAFGNIELAVQAIKAGAFDFISKPLKLPQLRNLIHNALKLTHDQEDSNVTLNLETETASQRRRHIMARLIGQSEAMKTLRNQIERLARSQAAVYVKGESGTGKEVVARMIHDLGARAEKPFVPVNCGAIPTELMESEFFGHKKGSFTGAHIDKIGLFQAADGGTLFLDEVADLPLAMQVKLLRAIQEKRIRTVGSSKEIEVDVRILSATHRDLAALVAQGKFRQDLFYRINVIELYVPPLRDRPDDIRPLVNNILKRFSLHLEIQDGEQLHISEEAIGALHSYPFPGNVRELENIIERAMTLCENNIIEIEDLQLPEPMDEFTLSAERGTSKLDPLLNVVEKETILNALKQTKGNKTKAAKLLGISFGALRYRLQKLKVGQKPE
ncbi:MAG: sigma-54 dependent transcriptional regulator [Pseudomonadota bacterium]|nr:sigma-54 dependent transcriptional regulator [Pseudomonadota bacterium]